MMRAQTHQTRNSNMDRIAMGREIEILIRAQAYADAGVNPTTLKLWREGVVVEMWCGGKRIDRLVTWREIETAHVNPVIQAIDVCSRELGSKPAGSN